jgi:S1-C subfamily serine protease
MSQCLGTMSQHDRIFSEGSATESPKSLHFFITLAAIIRKKMLRKPYDICCVLVVSSWFLIATSALSVSHNRATKRPSAEQFDCRDETRRNLLATATLLGSGLLSAPSNAFLNRDESARISIFERTAPSVVFIDTFISHKDDFSADITEVPLGAGSGFVWDTEGHIVTNFHVVRNAQAAQVAIISNSKCVPVSAPSLLSSKTSQATACSSNATPSKGTQPFTSMRPGSSFQNARAAYTARVVGVDPTKDVAVLKIDAPRNLLKPIKLGTSRDIKVGQQAFAIGNPFGLDHTLTAGIVSGVGRVVTSPSGRPISGVLQTDASINPGNSGGALLDSSGKLIGMNTAIYSPSGASAGIGFAIPIDTVKFVVEKLIKDGTIVRPMLGITLLGSVQARALGISSGVLVLGVPDNSPAALAGLRGTTRSEDGLVELGDVITKIGDTIVNTEADLFQALEACNVGDKVIVTVNRVAAVDDALKVKVLRLEITLLSSADIEQEKFAFR